jgi:hypothetical protein
VTGNTGSAAAATMADGGELGAGVGFHLGRKHQFLYRRSGLPLCPRLTEAGAGSQTLVGALGRGRGGRTGGYLGVWPSRGDPDSEGGLGVHNALGRRGASIGTRPEQRGRRGVPRRRPARTYFTVPLFERENLQNFELKCTKW